MRMAILAAGLVGAAVLGSGAAEAKSVYGVWKSQPDRDGAYIHVKVSNCGSGAVCGTIVKLVNGDPKHKNAKPRKIFWGMKPDGDNRWSGGRIWAPDDDQTYSSNLELKGANTLRVSGCVLGGVICRGQNWKRIR